jgi:hypothetical protein
MLVGRRTVAVGVSLTLAAGCSSSPQPESSFPDAASADASGRDSAAPADAKSLEDGGCSTVCSAQCYTDCQCAWQVLTADGCRETCTNAAVNCGTTASCVNGFCVYGDAGSRADAHFDATASESAGDADARDEARE